MLLHPTLLKSVRHPFVSSAYIVKMAGEDGSLSNVLVIQPPPGRGHTDGRLYSDFLENLDLISDMIAREEEQPIDRVDIRFH
jgi:hypothetical protein